MAGQDVGFFTQFADFIVRMLPTKDWTVAVAALVIGGIATPTARWLWNRSWPYALRLYQSVNSMTRIQGAIAPDGRGLWLADTIKIVPPSGYHEYFSDSNSSRIPIIVVANLKGGVGKTTTAANLIAHYANFRDEDVLAIDFDYQGSLSRMALADQDFNIELKDQAAGSICRASSLLRGKDAPWLVNAGLPVKDVPKARIVPSFYSLAGEESRVMLEWLLGVRSRDMRYDLSAVLHSPQVQGRFKRIIIDAPPRLTTACIQALCAATHVLIPTVLDDLSAEAVSTFAGQLYAHRELWPHLKIIGVVGTMTSHANVDASGKSIEGSLTATENDARVAAEDALKFALVDAPLSLRDTGVLPTKCFTPDKVELSRAAGHRIAYSTQGNAQTLKEVRASFDCLGGEIDQRIGISRS